MSILKKQIYIKDSKGVISNCCLCSAREDYHEEDIVMPITLDDGSVAYMLVVDVADPRASKLRISRDADGKEYAIGSEIVIPYKKTVIHNTGSIFIPIGVRTVKYTLIGGGGGGVHTFSNKSGTGVVAELTGGTGGTTSFLGIEATGGRGGSIKNSSITGGAGGSPNGHDGDANSHNNGNALGGAGVYEGRIRYGEGGSAGGISNTNNRKDVQAAGGSGGSVSGYIRGIQ